MPQSTHLTSQCAEPENAAVTVVDDVISSPLDTRKYRALTLSNKLNVLLVSDMSSEKAAAAMDVSVGSFSDPDSIPGLAHFLEHMLFLGTKKFPDEESYNAFLAENGGNSNAYTGCENTNFQFSIIISDRTKTSDDKSDEPRFKEALDRFSQFFISPLFTETATERELNAVDSEHQKNLQNDGRRIFQLRHSCANPEHPFSKFATGSKQTLYDIPKESSIDIRSKLIEFYHSHYSANLMNLCIQAPFSLDVLQSWVVELFSPIPNLDLTNLSENYKHLQPLKDDHKGLVYHVESVLDAHILEMAWIIPAYPYDNDSKPQRAITALLGDESKGSLLSHLKKLGWSESCYSTTYETDNFNMLLLNFTLTNDGIKHIDEIVSKVYQYIRMLKQLNGIPKWFFDEEANLADITFRFRELDDALSSTMRLSAKMGHLKPKEYHSGHFLLTKYDPEKMMEIIKALTPETCNVVISGQGEHISQKLNKTEKWYETKYGVEKLTDEQLRLWTTDPIHEELHLPPKNPFIPTDFQLVAEPLGKGKDVSGPELIEQNDHFELFHKLDRTFERPHAEVFIKLVTPLTYRSPWHAVMSELLGALLQDSLSEYTYPAQCAGFNYFFEKKDYGFHLHVYGYSHHIDTVLDAIVSKLRTFQTDEMRFDMQKDGLLRDYLNFNATPPYHQCMYKMSYMLEEPRYHITEYIELLKNEENGITWENMNKYAEDVMKRFWMTAMVIGNIDKVKSTEIISKVQRTLNYRPLPESEVIRRRVVQSPTEKSMFTRFPHANEEDSNSCIMLFHQFGAGGDPQADVTVELLDDILSKPCFHELRTVQQLGYIVHEGIYDNDGVMGMFIIVQSTACDPDELLNRMDGFLLKARDSVLGEMTDDKFEDYVKALVAKKAEPDGTLSKRAARFWFEISRGMMLFDRRTKEIEALRSVKKEDVVNLFDEKVAKGGPSTRRLVSQLYGNKHPFDARTTVEGEILTAEDALEFRRTHPLYAVVGNRAGRIMKKNSLKKQSCSINSLK